MGPLIEVTQDRSNTPTGPGAGALLITQLRPSLVRLSSARWMLA